MAIRRRPVELHVNHERWLVSYADFITLLFAFFVVMYSISQVSESKYRVLSATLTEVFNEPKRTIEPIQVGELDRSSRPQAIESGMVPQVDSQGAFDKTADLPQLSDQFTEQFADLIDDKLIQVNSNEYWLQISLNNSILFPLGSVKPSAEAETILADVAGLLRDFSNPVQVEGYTDNLAVSSRQFPSNWELSTARAAAVVKMLVDEGVAPQRLSAVGYGEFQPIAENETPEGREQNRRVVLMIAREKRPRPQVSTKAAISDAVEPAGREATQVNPQPGLEKTAVTPAEEASLSPREKMDRLIESNPAMGLETVLQLEQVPPAQLNEMDVPSNGDSSQQKIVPIETKNGGLLFTSDPDLPRKDR